LPEERKVRMDGIPKELGCFDKKEDAEDDD